MTLNYAYTHTCAYVCILPMSTVRSLIEFTQSINAVAGATVERSALLLRRSHSYVCALIHRHRFHSYTGCDVWVLVRRLQLLTGKLWWLCSVTSVLNLWQSSSALFQLKTGIGLTGSIGMRISECRNGPWKFAKSYNSSNHKQVRVLQTNFCDRQIP